MATNKLIIVESPAKVHTIKKFLGNGYEVIASNGHIRDLPKSRLGVDVENDFEPQYITIRGKGDVMSALKKEIKKADKIYLATDPDREGEAISWHLKNALNMDGKDVSRITFNEITKNAVKEALKNPKEINTDLVNAQQARRVLDRVVGYQISPILWKKVKGKLSAGRVQSAVLSMISEREKEIASFVPKEYWTLDAELKKDNKKMVASYYGRGSRKKELTSEADVEKVLAAVEGKDFVLTEKKSAKRTKNPPNPFTTSTLQQDAANRLNFSTQKTMRLAQELYEGVHVKGHGTVGLITYLRTDSIRVSEEADRAVKAMIASKYGQDAVGQGAQAKNGNGVQDAHEAIRPTDLTLTPDSLKNDLSRDSLRLYQLIYSRFVASRMRPAVYDTTSVHFAAGEEVFTASSTSLVQPGYLTVYNQDEEKAVAVSLIASLEAGDVLKLSSFKKEQHFTQPPAHFTEASLVRAMEENGLGRPSTYAPTITNILGRHYITKEGRSLYMTELGEAVNGIMENSFPDIVDLNFTAQMENELDAVENGEKDWHEVMHEFYPGFEKELKAAEEEVEKIKVEDELSDETCELCGRRMVIKYGKHGKFLACPGFPECRNTRPFLEKIGVKCPKCGKDIVVRRTKSGRRFYGCEGAPECDYMSWTRPKEESTAS